VVAALLLGVAAGAAATPQPMSRAAIIDLSKSAMGYSYYWGHGSWRDDGTQVGSCSGSCPSCTHTGTYGADCSGLAGKVWQVPSPSPITTDLHPYATTNFRNDMTWWTEIDRGAVQLADALVYNTNGAGHIFIYESGDGWGSMWAYECKGCSYGCVHDLRTASSSYIAIRRVQLAEQTDAGASDAAVDAGVPADAGAADDAGGADGGLAGDGGGAAVDGGDPCGPDTCDPTPDAPPPVLHGGCAVGAGAAGALAGLASLGGLLLVRRRRRRGYGRPMP
jgi:MYXO-CTERM domain-containing protein